MQTTDNLNPKSADLPDLLLLSKSFAFDPRKRLERLKSPFAIWQIRAPYNMIFM